MKNENMFIFLCKKIFTFLFYYTKKGVCKNVGGKTMHVCSIANQKGGVGKTTTTQNLGMALGKKKKVLLIDLDAQGNLTDACGLSSPEYSAYEVLSGDRALADSVFHLSNHIDLLPATRNLAVAELAFASRMGRENLMKKALQNSSYDFVLIDCPPSLGLLTVNALTASDSLLIPVQAEYYALAGLDLILETMNSVVENLNPKLHLLGILLTFFDKRKSLNRDVLIGLQERWGKLLFSTLIRDNVSLAEAPSDGHNIFEYRPKSYGAQDYSALAKEFLARVKKQ